MTTQTAPLLTVTVAGHPYSANDHVSPITRHRNHKAYRDNMTWQVRSLINELVLAKRVPLERVRVQATLTYTRATFKDDDNAHSCCKPLVDGLVHGGFVVDDGPAHVELMRPVQVVGVQRTVTLDVWAMEDGDG